MIPSEPRPEMAKAVRMLMEKYTIDEIAEKICKSRFWIQRLLEEHP